MQFAKNQPRRGDNDRRPQTDNRPRVRERECDRGGDDQRKPFVLRCGRKSEKQRAMSHRGVVPSPQKQQPRSAERDDRPLGQSDHARQREERRGEGDRRGNERQREDSN